MTCGHYDLPKLDISGIALNGNSGEAVLSGQTPLPLKKSTTADQIVRYAPCFVQIHQSFIINIDYLMIIKDGKCVLYPPFENVDELLVSKKYKKELQDRYCL